jgi:RNA polymerase sigma-70 factor (ECF subfamily)
LSFRQVAARLLPRLERHRKEKALPSGTGTGPFDEQSHSSPRTVTMAHFSALMQDTSFAAQGMRLSDDFLVSAAQAGQEWAFVELCSRHSRRLLYTLYRITKNREDAEDALQESIANAFIHLGRFNRNSSFSTWLTRISVNSALMILRRKRARPEVSMDAPVEGNDDTFYWEISDGRGTPEEHYIHGENQRRLRHAVDNLPTIYRHVFELHQKSDSGLSDIAEKTGISVGATKTRLLRARKAIRKSLM